MRQNQVKKSVSNRPLITIITATYNAEKYLPAAIQSIREQTYDNIEYIIVDGGSTDSTLDIIKDNESIVDHWISEPDSGIYNAWNKGVRLSHGDWIAFLGADDRYLESAISQYVTLILDCNAPPPQYISSRVNLILGSTVLRTIGEKWKWPTFCRYMNVAHVGSLHHRSLFERYGSFDESYRASGDYEFLLRPRSNLVASYLNEITVSMNVEGISNTNKISFCETEKAKISTGGRSILLCRIEKYWALIKWKLRKVIDNQF